MKLMCVGPSSLIGPACTEALSEAEEAGRREGQTILVGAQISHMVRHREAFNWVCILGEEEWKYS